MLQLAEETKLVAAKMLMLCENFLIKMQQNGDHNSFSDYKQEDTAAF